MFENESSYSWRNFHVAVPILRAFEANVVEKWSCMTWYLTPMNFPYDPLKTGH
jgi:hypothetical protein